MRSYSDLHEYQRQANQLQASSPASALVLDPGLGKTVITLTAIHDLMDRMVLNGVVVLAPKRVCETVWEQECDQWTHLPHIRFAHVYGSARHREAQMAKPADIYLVN